MMKFISLVLANIMAVSAAAAAPEGRYMAALNITFPDEVTIPFDNGVYKFLEYMLPDIIKPHLDPVVPAGMTLDVSVVNIHIEESTLVLAFPKVPGAIVTMIDESGLLVGVIKTIFGEIVSFLRISCDADCIAACVDDADGFVATAGFTCGQAYSMVSQNCDTDLSTFSGDIPKGTTLKELCPKTCETCSNTIEVTLEGKTYANTRLKPTLGLKPLGLHVTLTSDAIKSEELVSFVENDLQGIFEEYVPAEIRNASFCLTKLTESTSSDTTVNGQESRVTITFPTETCEGLLMAIQCLAVDTNFLLDIVHTEQEHLSFTVFSQTDVPTTSPTAAPTKAPTEAPTEPPTKAPTRATDSGGPGSGSTPNADATTPANGSESGSGSDADATTAVPESTTTDGAVSAAMTNAISFLVVSVCAFSF